MLYMFHQCRTYITPYTTTNSIDGLPHQYRRLMPVAVMVMYSARRAGSALLHLPLHRSKRLRILHVMQVGLPEGPIIYACSNQLYKYDPETFATWMRILHRVPDRCAGSPVLLPGGIRFMRAHAAWLHRSMLLKGCQGAK